MNRKPLTKPWLLCIGLILLTALVYLPVKDYEFIKLDDGVYVYENPYVLQGLSLDNIIWAFTEVWQNYWLPGLWISYMIDTTLFGTDPAGYHLVNLFFHLVNVLLLYHVLNRMTRRPWPSLFVAAVFALHPLRIESVAWITERKDLLSTFYWFLSLWAYLRYVEKPGWKPMTLVVLFMAVGLLVKPMIVTLPFVLLLLDFWPLDRMKNEQVRFLHFSWPLIVEKVPLFVLSLAGCVITYFNQAKGGSIVGQEVFPIMERLLHAIGAYAFYMKKFFWPVDLAVIYPQNVTLFSAPIVFFALLSFVITLLALFQWRKQPQVTMGWFWFLGTLVPIIGLVRVGFVHVADRFTYVPLIGVTIALAWGVAGLVERSRGMLRLCVVGSCLVLAACVLVTRSQLGFWKDSWVLFNRALEVTHDNYFINSKIGVIHADARENEQAERFYRESLRIKPKFSEGHNNLAVILARTGRDDEALHHLQIALSLKPDYADAHANMARQFQIRERFEEAIHHYQEHNRFKPGVYEIWHNLGVALVRVGKREQAVSAYREAIRLNPEPGDTRMSLAQLLFELGRVKEAEKEILSQVQRSPQNAEVHYNLGVLYVQTDRFENAMKSFRRAADVDPENERAKSSAEQLVADVNNRAWTLATAADESQRNGKEAVKLAEMAARWTNHENPGILDTLAAAYAEKGNFEKAIQTAEMGFGLAREKREGELVKMIEEHLKLYMKNVAVRE